MLKTLVCRQQQVKAVYTDVLSPFPKEITQLQDQMVEFESSMLVGSPYKTLRQSTVIKLASTQVRLIECDHSIKKDRLLRRNKQ